IHGGAGDDILVGGSSGDDLFGDDGNDIIVGDNARITRDASNVVQVIATIFPDQGGNDTIQGNHGNDIALGGFGSDDMHGGANDDVLLGDNGLLSYIIDANPSTLDLITTTVPTLGASDTIHGDDGNDIVLGGTAGDMIDGDAGDDILLGDQGKLDLTGARTTPPIPPL